MAPMPSSRIRRRALGLVAGFALTTALVGYYYFAISRPVGRGPAGPAIDHALFRNPWTTRPVALVGLGDSVTAGFGARRGYSYFDRLIAPPADGDPVLRGVCLSAVLPNLRATNLSMSGSTSLQQVRAQLPKLVRHDSNVLGLVVLTTGGNDLIHNYGRTPPVEGAMYGATREQAGPWITNFASRLEGMVQTITATFPGGCHIFLADIYDPTDGVGDLERAGLPRWPEARPIHAAYNRVIAECAARHTNVHLVEIHAAFIGHGIHCTEFWREVYRAQDPHYWYHENLEDPNERGYDALGRLFLLAIARVLAPSGTP